MANVMHTSTEITIYEPPNIGNIKVKFADGISTIGCVAGLLGLTEMEVYLIATDKRVAVKRVALI